MENSSKLFCLKEEYKKVSMAFSLQKKIEEIRREPEAVRMRYVTMGVSFSMVLIVGIWLLAVQDSVSTVAKDIPAVLQNGKELTGGAPSLTDLFEQAAPLRIDEETTNGKEFFDQRVKEKEVLKDME